MAANAWRPAPSNYSHKRAPLVKAAAQAALPAGYSIENYYPPKDNYGRDQLFEALGLAVAKDGTDRRRHAHRRHLAHRRRRVAPVRRRAVRQPRRGGRRRQGSHRGRRPEGRADPHLATPTATASPTSYETLFDAHSYHGNYHSYMHGPVRGKDGAYYFALNLVHDGTGSAYTAGGNVMGTWGGFNGWAVRVEPNGKFELFANGLRSPASLGVGPDGRVWYADNQGDFVGTSKMFELRKDAFYGHPAGLVDLPGMTPDSPEIKWEQGGRAQASARSSCSRTTAWRIRPAIPRG